MNQSPIGVTGIPQPIVFENSPIFVAECSDGFYHQVYELKKETGQEILAVSGTIYCLGCKKFHKTILDGNGNVIDIVAPHRGHGNVLE